MPFYHEIPPRVLVGILHTELTTIAWSFGLRNLILPPGSDFLPIAGQPYDMARNTICAAAIHNGFDYVFHFDSDVIPPRDAVMRLLAHRKSIISGIYHRRSPPHGIPVMLKNGQWLGGYPANTLLDVDLVGAGCLLLDTEMLKRCPPIKPGKPWFSWQVDQPKDEKNPGWELSEDFVFCRWARERMGIPTLVDTSVICKHVGLCEAGLHSMIPLNTTPHT